MPRFCQALRDARAKNAIHYNNGRSCKKGHRAVRFVSTMTCVQCSKEAQRRKNKGVKAHFHPFCTIWKAAKSCKNRKEFKTRFPRLYGAAYKRDIVQKICSHMPAARTAPKWTFCRVYNLARSYSTQGEFISKHAGALDYALNKGFWSHVSAHMERLNSDYDAVYIWGFWRDDVLICKVGVTSERLGMKRIDSVSRKSGLPVEFCIVAKSGCALDAEKELKIVGQKEPLNGFNGSSEFRRFSNQDLTKAYEVIYGYADGTT